MRHSKFQSVLLTAAVLAAGAGFTQSIFAAQVPDHVVVVIEENHDSDQILGNSNAPYINHLFQTGLYFTNAHGTDHDSQPNYLELFSGDNPGLKGYNSQGPGADADGYGGAVQQKYPTSVTDAAVTKGDNLSDNANTIPFSTPNLASALGGVGKTFTGYSEGLPIAGSNVVFATGAAGNRSYVQKHNPWVQWQGGGANQLDQSTNQPLSAFPSNFSNLSTVSFVVPNEQNDEHDTVSKIGLYTKGFSDPSSPDYKNPYAVGNDIFGNPVNDAATIQNSDTWLQNHLGAYADWAKTHNSLLITLWDENDYDLTNLNDISISINGATNLVKPSTFDGYVNHFDVLKYLESIYGASLTGLAATADGLPVNADGVLVGDGAPIPEPASLALLAGGLIALTARRRTR